MVDFFCCQKEWFHFLNTTIQSLDVYIMYDFQIKKIVNWLSSPLSTVTCAGDAQIAPEQGMHKDQFAEGTSEILLTSEDGVKDLLILQPL